MYLPTRRLYHLSELPLAESLPARQEVPLRRPQKVRSSVLYPADTLREYRLKAGFFRLPTL